MISITLLSLASETLQRMAEHQTRTETSCRRSERLVVLAFVEAVSLAAATVAILAG
jgi:hypothetical protein